MLPQFSWSCFFELPAGAEKGRHLKVPTLPPISTGEESRRIPHQDHALARRALRDADQLSAVPCLLVDGYLQDPAERRGMFAAGDCLTGRCRDPRRAAARADGLSSFGCLSSCGRAAARREQATAMLSTPRARCKRLSKRVYPSGSARAAAPAAILPPAPPRFSTTIC